MRIRRAVYTHSPRERPIARLEVVDSGFSDLSIAGDDAVAVGGASVVWMPFSRYNRAYGWELGRLVRSMPPRLAQCRLHPLGL